MRPVRISLIAGVLMMWLAGSASALSRPIAIGSNAPMLSSMPAVAVDPTGTAYIAWLGPPATATLNFCKVPLGATGCHPVSLMVPGPGRATYFDPPSVLVLGAVVYVYEYVGGAADPSQTGMYEWVSTDSGASFAPFPYPVSYTRVPDATGTGPMPLVLLPNGDRAFGYLTANGDPVFQANTVSPPRNYSAATYPPTSPAPPFARLSANPDDYLVGNLGGEIVSQLTGATGLLGVFGLMDAGPCPTSDGLVFTYAGTSAATSDASLDTSPGPASPWSPLAPVACGASSPAVAGGPGGLGLLYTSDAGATGSIQYRSFSPPATFGSPVTVAPGSANEPTLTEDASAGLYATWLESGVGLELAYSPDGGATWVGPNTLSGENGGAVTLNGIASATNASGQGWAVFEAGGTEYAQPFAAADASPPKGR